VIATRPTRSADEAVGVAVNTASVLGMELCLPGSGGGVTSRDAMSALPEADGNAHWLLSRCFRCIADGSPGADRISWAEVLGIMALAARIAVVDGDTAWRPARAQAITGIEARVIP
jgi:hypothetical protein